MPRSQKGCNLKRFTIGLIACDISEEVTHAVWQGIGEAARSADINLIFFAGGAPIFSGIIISPASPYQALPFTTPGRLVLSSNQQIFTDLHVLYQEGQRSFSFLVLYKGVPIEAVALLHYLEDERAWFTVQSPGLACVHASRRVVVLSNGMLEPVEGQVIVVHPSIAQVALGEFCFAGGKLSKRRELRVEPISPFLATLQDGVISVDARIVDLSLRGAGICLDAEFPVEASQGKSLQVNFQLPGGDVRLQAKLRSTSRLAQGSRLSVEFTGIEPGRSLVLRYLMQRRAEIFAEVHQLHAGFLTKL